MPSSFHFTIVFAGLLAWWLIARANRTTAPATLANLVVLAAQQLVLTLTARGVQIYTFRAVSVQPAKVSWTLQALEADLFNAQRHKVGRHFAGPTWTSEADDKVIGKPKTKADASDSKVYPGYC